MKRILIAFFAGFVLCSPAFGFGHECHDIITVLADKHLKPSAKKTIEKYLGGHSIMYYSTWMDDWRKGTKYEFTDTWHAFSVDEDLKYFARPQGDAVQAINNAVEILKDYKNQNDSTVVVNLKYIIHCVADMHCPSHNYWDKKAFPQYRYNLTNKKGKKQSYHSYWDNALNYGRRKWTAEQYADAVDKATPKEYKAIVKGTAYRWADTSLPNFLRTFELTPKDSNVDAYSKKTRLEIRDICDEEAMKGGYRLAHVLNTIFKK